MLSSIEFSPDELADSGNLNQRKQLIEALAHLDECGSLFVPEAADLEAIRVAMDSDFASLLERNAEAKLIEALRKCEALSSEFDIVIANPPYRNSGKMSPWLSAWLKKHYPDEKSDLFAAFIWRMNCMRSKDGVMAAAASNSWMFISSFENARKKLLAEVDIAALVQLSVHGFEGIAAQVFAFSCVDKQVSSYEGGYIRLNDFDHHSLQAPKTLEAIANPDCGWFYRRPADSFKSIPGTPIAYWASDAMRNDFEISKPLSKIGQPRQGLATGENARFVRQWWEVDQDKSKYNCTSIADSLDCMCRWFPYNKGGEFRKWYGNNDCVVNWEGDGEEIRAFSGSVIRNPQFYFRPSITWSKISSGTIAFRYKPAGHAFDVAGTSVFANERQLAYLQGLCNSSVIHVIASMLSPTLNFEVGQIATYPVIESEEYEEVICSVVGCLRATSQSDWDSFETSWDFKCHPLV